MKVYTILEIDSINFTEIISHSLLREYFPKKQDLTEIKPSLIRDKALILNQRPRKCLNWKSPFEVYFDISLHLT